MYIIPCQQSKESRGNSLTISNDDRFRPRSLKCPGNEKQTPTGLTYLRLCSNRPQANQSRWIPYIHYNRPQTGRRAAFDRSPRARRPLTVKSRPARNLAGRDRNLRMRSALLLRVSSLYRFTQPRNRMSITSKFDPHHSPSHLSRRGAHTLPKPGVSTSFADTPCPAALATSRASVSLAASTAKQWTAGLGPNMMAPRARKISPSCRN